MKSLILKIFTSLGNRQFIRVYTDRGSHFSIYQQFNVEVRWKSHHRKNGVEHHYETNHKLYDKIMDEERIVKVEQFHQGLSVCIFPVQPSIMCYLPKLALSHQNFENSCTKQQIDTVRD